MGWRNVPGVKPVSRYARSVAHPGQGPELATILLRAAGSLASDPGCLLYLVNHQAGDPDTIWVTEMWRNQADLDACLARIRGSDQAAAAMALVKSWEMVELEALGGKGPGGTQPVTPD